MGAAPDAVWQAPRLAGWPGLSSGPIPGSIPFSEVTETLPAVHKSSRGQSPDIFFPARGKSAEVAKAICSGCPVQRERPTTGRSVKLLRCPSSFQTPGRRPESVSIGGPVPIYGNRPIVEACDVAPERRPHHSRHNKHGDDFDVKAFDAEKSL